MNKAIHIYDNLQIKTLDPLEGFTPETATVLEIEGYASQTYTETGKKVVDRDQEVVNTASMDLDSFKKNPIMLYNHNFNAPIGKVVAIDKTAQGLYVKAEVHRLSGYENVFEAVQKGILKSLSIGFTADKYEYLEDEDVFEISNASLFEVSLAPVQSNPNALFTVTGTKALSIAAKDVAEMNDLTLCELKGICGVKTKTIQSQEKEDEPVNTKTSTEEVAPPETIVETPPAETQKPVTKVEEPTPEVVVNATVDTEALTTAIQNAQQAAIDNAAAAKKAEDEAAEAAAVAATEKQEQFVKDAFEYFNTEAENIRTMDEADVSVESLEGIYEFSTGLVDAIEGRIQSMIEAEVKED